MATKIEKIYQKNKAAKVGEQIECPSCGASFRKRSYQQAFCKTLSGTICKDKYWNTVIPDKRNNTTRISKARAEYLENRDYYFDDDQSWDAHKQR